ncbi:MAG TPA: glycosyltransferase family 39 protein [Vicinamibacterales bacterium]
MNRRLLLLVVLVAAVVPYFVDLGGSSIWDANEAFYVETPREMIERHDFIAPTFNYEPRFNKPVLSYWIVAGFYKVFGVSVGVQRIPIALGAILMILTAFFLARAASPEPSDPSRGLDAALWAALGLAVAPRLLMFSRRIFIDIYISMFMGLTLLFFALAERYPARRRLFLVLMYVAVGLGTLTKGPVAIALPGLVFGLYLVLHGELKRVRDMMILPGIAIVLAIVVPWYAALYQRFGWTYITSFFIGENVARYTEGVGVRPVRGPWYYLPVLFSDSFPWSLCLIGAAAMWFSDRRSLSGTNVPEAHAALRIRSLLWLWILAITLFFTLSAAKQDLYIFPIVPAIAALAGIFIARGEEGGEARWATPLRITAAAAGLLLAIGGLGTLYIFHAAGKVYALDGAATVGFVGTAGGLLTIVLALMKRARHALIALALTMITLNWTFVWQVLPSFEQYKPVPQLSAALEQRVRPEDRIVHYNVALPSMVYYLRRHIDMFFEAPQFIEALRGGETVYAILSESDYDRLEGEIGVKTCVIQRAPTVNVKLNAVLARAPLPQVILITNKCE